MNTSNGLVAPSELHRALEAASDASEYERHEILSRVLASENFAVIRRIPDLLLPFQKDEVNTVFDWAVGMVSRNDIDVSDRDFILHLLVGCRVPTDLILELLQRHGVYGQKALAHVEQALKGDRSKFDQCIRQVADELLKEARLPSRDRARHIYMTIAKTPEDWRALAKQFTDNFLDLRQRVIERFLRDCNDEVAVELFCHEVIDQCLGRIDEAVTGHQVAPQLHWVISCGERVGWKFKNLKPIVVGFMEDFGRTLPQSVVRRILDIV